MKFKLLIFFAGISFVCSIIFSIYYSLRIVDENTRINNNQIVFSKLLIINQDIENNLANYNSLQTLTTTIQNFSFQEINNTIDLNQ